MSIENGNLGDQLNEMDDERQSAGLAKFDRRVRETYGFEIDSDTLENEANASRCACVSPLPPMFCCSLSRRYAIDPVYSRGFSEADVGYVVEVS